MVAAQSSGERIALGSNPLSRLDSVHVPFRATRRSPAGGVRLPDKLGVPVLQVRRLMRTGWRTHRAVVMAAVSTCGRTSVRRHRRCNTQKMDERARGRFHLRHIANPFAHRTAFRLTLGQVG